MVNVSKFIDVSEGLKAGQFGVGDRENITSISDLDPTYKQLMDKPYACVMAVMGPSGRPNLTPMWFDYEGDKVLVNVASHRKKTGWIRDNPQISIVIVNPENMYHWLSMKVTVNPCAVAFSRACSSARLLISVAVIVACGRSLASASAIAPLPVPRSRMASA